MNFGYSPNQCLVTAGWLAATFYGLLALWAVGSRFRWSWHVTPLAVALAALIPMGGVQPLLIFGSEATAVIAFVSLVAVIRRYRNTQVEELLNPRPSRRIALRDGVAAILILVSVLALAKNAAYPGDAVVMLPWWRYAITGVGFAAVTSAAFLLVANRSRWYWRMLLTLSLLTAGMLLLALGNFSEHFIYFSVDYLLQPAEEQGNNEWIVVLPLAQLWQTALLLLLVNLAGWQWWPSHAPPFTWAVFDVQRWPKASRFVQALTRMLTIVSTLVLVGSVATIYWSLLLLDIHPR